jgi:hypothetical protein
MKIKAIVAGLALAFSAGAANATIEDDTNGGSLFLSVNKILGPTSDVNETFVFDLNTSIADFIAGNFGTVETIGGTEVRTYSLTSLFADFSSSFGSTGVLTYNVAGVSVLTTDVNGSADGGSSSQGAVVTSVEDLPSPDWGTLTTFSNMKATIDVQAGEANVSLDANDAVVAGNGLGGDYDETWGNNLNGQLGNGYDNDMSLDGTESVFNAEDWMSMFVVGRTGGSLTKNNAFQFGYVFLDLANDKLIFSNSIPTAVPVPAAVWLLGSSLLGFIGLGSRKNKALSA